jgi:penicillin amidase
MRSWLRGHRRLVRVGLGALAALVALALVAGLAAVWAVRRAFPDHDGELTLPGLSAPVTVYRDEHGIPQIYAATAGDLFRAQGFVHAQDRFWEMDLRRHITSGRLAEWFGEAEVDTDSYLRTLGWRRVAEAEWRRASPEVVDYLVAYADGVNAWIEETSGPGATGRKALQYQVLGLRNPGYEVEPWSPVDTLAWLKAMAWDLRTNLAHEIERARLLSGGLTRAEVEQLYPAYPYQEHAPIVPDGDLGGRTGGSGGALADGPRGPAFTGIGSNSWVVGAEHTATGAPILVNDPHLGVSMPGIWYQVGLHCRCGYQASGFSFSGVPGVVIGHNDRIAWGFTNLGADVTDLYLERVDGDRYQVDGEWQRMDVRRERIEVAGGDDVLVDVRSTHHGPVLSDADEQLRDLAASEAVIGEAGGDPAGGDHAISLAWTALRPGSTIEALFVLNQAQGWEDFRRAASLFEVPAQNLTYADVDGNIGYQAPGVFPIRGTGDGSWPAPGWDSGYDWDGSVPFEDLPSAFNPAGGMIVTANQPVTGPDYPHLLTRDWSYGYRSDRIHHLLAEATASGPLTVADMERMLMDDVDGFAPTLVPALLAAPHPPRSADEQAAVDLLRGWDFRNEEDSAAAAYYHAVWRQLLALAFDELPDELAPTGGDRWFQVFAGLLEDPTSPWWDRQGTGPTETRDDVLARAMSEGYLELAVAHGDDPRDWRWGRLHTLTLRDATFGSSGIGPVEALFNRGPVPASGGIDIVNATSWDASKGYAVTAAPSMRMIVDLSDLDGSRWIQLTGNSGHPYHPNYVDQLELWRTGGMLRWPWRRPTIEDAATGTLVLSPG